MRFWDSSALVSLLAVQAHAPTAAAWLRADPSIVVWTLTPTEVTSALERLKRDGLLDAVAVGKAEARAERYLRAAFVVEEVSEVQPIARRLLRSHPLRAADALQLAAALVWARERPLRRMFLTFDQRLAEAATREGFTVL